MADRRSRSRRWGRGLLVGSLLLFAWAALVVVTGGFRFDLGPLRVSSRNPGRVVLLAILAAALAWHLAYRETLAKRLRQLPSFTAQIDSALRASARGLERAAVLLVWALAAAVLVCGIRYGSRVAGGADAFGYLSASLLWANGVLGIDEGGAANLPWPGAAGSFVPLAYRLGINDVMGPTVAPGLPLLMAVARMFSACGPYLLMPLCGGALVLMTFQLGRQIFNPATALVGAALVACSPVVVFESLVVMADVPAAAFWMCALVAALSRTGRGTLLSGILAGIAILIRPNLLPLGIFPWLLAVARCQTIMTASQRTALFAIGSVPAALFIAWVNQRVYGSPLRSGYGDVGGAFALDHAIANLRLYSGWWLESQGLVAFLFVAAIFRRTYARQRELIIVVGYGVCTGLLYVFYLPFDQWWYLRFLIPAIPVVFLLSADVVTWATAWSPSARMAALIVFVAFAAGHALSFIGSKDILANSAAERRRYLDAAVYVDGTLPRDAVVLAMQHSGSVRYYTGRLTMRWDVLDAASLDVAAEALRARDLPVYALLESWEEQEFRARFAGQRAVGALSAGAMARSADGELRLYALFGGAGPDRSEVVIPASADDQCVDASPRFIHPDAERRLAAAAGR